MEINSWFDPIKNILIGLFLLCVALPILVWLLTTLGKLIVNIIAIPFGLVIIAMGKLFEKGRSIVFPQSVKPNYYAFYKPISDFDSSQHFVLREDVQYCLSNRNQPSKYVVAPWNDLAHLESLIEFRKQLTDFLLWLDKSREPGVNQEVLDGLWGVLNQIAAWQLAITHDMHLVKAVRLDQNANECAAWVSLGGTYDAMKNMAVELQKSKHDWGDLLQINTLKNLVSSDSTKQQEYDRLGAVLALNAAWGAQFDKLFLSVRAEGLL